MLPGAGAKIARSAGSEVRLISIDGGQASLKMPSGEIRLVKENCRATIGSVGNGSHQKSTIGKAGRNRWKGRRPRVRGVAMNPVDHPMGGGEGRTSEADIPCRLGDSFQKAIQREKIQTIQFANIGSSEWTKSKIRYTYDSSIKKGSLSNQV